MSVCVYYSLLCTFMVEYLGRRINQKKGQLYRMALLENLHFGVFLSSRADVSVIPSTYYA